MALTNLNNTHLTAAQLTAAQTAITALETALAPITLHRKTAKNMAASTSKISFL
ncbi:hypothetical protein [Chryseobacterium populi]|uniref:Uncharacterized protein n=1 Tax=Chryseobacterium populi TaxID=1144316 RepID=J2JJY1_9FLAO|nr:hypothetical protein PMI13_03837 [Chryseobacterium populi]